MFVNEKCLHQTEVFFGSIQMCALHKTVKETLFLYCSDHFSLYSAVCIFSQCTAGSPRALKVSHSSLKVDFGIQTS